MNNNIIRVCSCFLLFYLCRCVTSLFGYFSVDYDAPLSEAGDITDKFRALKKVIEKYNPDAKKQSN